VLLHLIVGTLVGWWASILPGKISKWRLEGDNGIIINTSSPVAIPSEDKKRSKFEKGVFVMWILLILLYIQSYYKIGEPLLPAHVSLNILVRSVLIVLTWYFVASPLIKQFLHWWLRRKRTKAQPDIQKVLELLPDTQQLAAKSWKLAGKHYQQKRGIARLIATGKTILVNALNEDTARQVVILNGSIQIEQDPISHHLINCILNEQVYLSKLGRRAGFIRTGQDIILRRVLLHNCLNL